MTGFVADYPTEILSACSVVFAWFEVVGKEENAAEGCGSHGEWESMGWAGFGAGRAALRPGAKCELRIRSGCSPGWYHRA